jgi:predicted permease
MRWIRRIRYWLRFRAEQADLRRELALHEQWRAEELERAGYTRSDAAAGAQRAMGNEAYMREEARGVWLPVRIDAFLGDWRYAWRGLRRSPGFTIVAVISLAIGIGANTAIFGVIHSLLLARLPVRSPEELVQLVRAIPDQGLDERLSRAEFDALAASPLPLTLFASSFASFDANGATSNVSIDAVDGRYFSLVGVGALRGRLIGPADEDAPIAVVTERFWRTRLDGDSATIGRSIRIDGHLFAIVGITPPGFAGLRFPSLTDVMIPYRTATALRIIRERDHGSAVVTVVGRRDPGQSLASIERDLAAMWARCCAMDAGAFPSSGRSTSPTTLRVLDISRGIPQQKLDLRGEYRRILFALMAGVAILLLAACANVANLLLARANARSAELAVRLALGASRQRVAVQLLIESAQLALLGGAAGALLAWWATVVLARARVGDLSSVISASPNGSVLGFTAGVSLASVLVFGLLPATRILRSDLLSPLRPGGQRISRSAHGIVDMMLVATQVALALVLVCGAALLVQTLRQLQDAKLGFDPAERLVLSVETRHTPYERQGMTVPLANEMLRRIGELPGVRSAAFASLMPIAGGRGAYDNVTTTGDRPREDGSAQAWFVGVTPGYFSTLGMTIIEGRDLTANATLTRGAREVLVNERFARKYFADRDPVGQSFRDADDGDSTATTDRIVGVVADAKYMSVRAAPEPMYFVPVTDGSWPFLILVTRLTGTTGAIGGNILRSVVAVAPGIAARDPQSLASAVDDALSRERLAARLATLFGAVALALVAIGLYGVLLYRVAERTREIGIRMALGADARGVVGLVLRQSLRVVALGAMVGVPLALLAGRAVSSQLYGVAPYSPGVLGITLGVVLLTAAVATVLPVRRAIRVDPLTALRGE